MVRSKLPVVLLFVVCLVAACAGPGDGKSKTVTADTGCLLFLLAGQSNMVGRGEYGELPPGEQGLPGNVQLHAIALDTRLQAVEGRFGPEQGLAGVLGPAYPGRELVLVKYAVDASSLLDWAPDWDRQAAAISGNSQFGPLYTGLLAFVDEVGATAGLDCRPAAVFWMQGERDARIPEAGARYEENLVELIARLRADLGVLDLPFFVGQIDPRAGNYSARDQVREAQAAVAKRVAGVWLVSTEGLSKLPDGLHYDTAGQIELGQRFARAYLEVVE
jgi:hypothetical protein